MELQPPFRKIIHVDMDAYYASVAQLDNPELKGKAIAKECRKWIEEKVKFKTNAKNGFIQPQFIYNSRQF